MLPPLEMPLLQAKHRCKQPEVYAWVWVKHVYCMKNLQGAICQLAPEQIIFHGSYTSSYGTAHCREWREEKRERENSSDVINFITEDIARSRLLTWLPAASRPSSLPH